MPFSWILLLWMSLLSQPVDSKPQYVVTIEPLSQIVQELSKGRAEVHTLLPSGASPHAYSPKPSDVRMVSRAKALFYGDESLDAFAKTLPSATHFALFEMVPEGMRHHLKRQEDHHANEEAHEHHHHGEDPHFWTDPLTVKAMLPALTKTLCRLDQPGCPVYQRNEQGFSKRLDALHLKLSAMMKPYAGTVVMQDHPFFNYFLQRYGLHPVGVVELNPAVEPSPKSLKKIMDHARKNKVRLILTHPQLNDRAARLVGENLGLATLRLDPLGASVKPGYESLLLENATRLVTALKGVLNER